MEQIAIYPYNSSFAPVIRHQKLIYDMSIKSLISPRGWGLNNECVKTYDGEFIISDNFAAGIEDCSIVWFVDDAYIPLPKTLLKTRLLEALGMNKKILYTRSLETDEEDIKRLIPKEQDIKIEIKNYFPERRSKACFNIETPVIFVLGLTENTDKYEIQVALREQFIHYGYRVSSVSSRHDSAILGMHPLPDFMFDTCMSETEKILSYNHFIKQIELNESPDVLIIGIPGGAFPFSRYKHNYFGITTYEISNAVTCDFAVFCSPYLDYSLDLSYFTRVSKEINSRFGFPIDCFHIAARTYDYLFEQPNEEDFNWVTLDELFVDTNIKKYKQENVCNLLRTEEIKKLTETIIDQLSETSKAKSI